MKLISRLFLTSIVLSIVLSMATIPFLPSLPRSGAAESDDTESDDTESDDAVPDDAAADDAGVGKLASVLILVTSLAKPRCTHELSHLCGGIDYMAFGTDGGLMGSR